MVLHPQACCMLNAWYRTSYGASVSSSCGSTHPAFESDSKTLALFFFLQESLIYAQQYVLNSLLIPVAGPQGDRCHCRYYSYCTRCVLASCTGRQRQRQ